jgi:hypothetical protein
VAHARDEPVSSEYFPPRSPRGRSRELAGIRVEAGIDLDPVAAYAYIKNNQGARFLNWDVSRKKSPAIGALFAEGKYRLLAGCALCQPFSKLTNGITEHGSWDLLDNFARFALRASVFQLLRPTLPHSLARSISIASNGSIRTLESSA